MQVAHHCLASPARPAIMATSGIHRASFFVDAPSLQMLVFASDFASAWCETGRRGRKTKY